MRSKGFTLIELLVVIAIIGILAAMILPAFKNHKTHNKPAAEQTFTNTTTNGW